MYFPPPSSTIFWLISLRHMVAVFFGFGPVQQQRRCLSASTERARVERMVMERRISSDFGLFVFYFCKVERGGYV